MKQRLLSILPTRIFLEIRWLDFKISNRKAFDNIQRQRRSEGDGNYSFKPFDEKKSIFVHIPKCAGVSVNKALFGGLAGGHTTLEEYLNIFDPQSISSYFKFTFVRNPWDRLVSAYHFLEKGGFGESDKHWFEKELRCYSGFEDFVLNWLNKENIWKWHHFRPQYHYILDKRRKVKLDFIGFVENIDEDFSYVRKRIPGSAQLPKSNKSKHSDYLDYYTDELAEIVANVYREDIDLLGYAFDNSSLSKQLANRSALT